MKRRTSPAEIPGYRDLRPEEIEADVRTIAAHRGRGRAESLYAARGAEQQLAERAVDPREDSGAAFAALSALIAQAKATGAELPSRDVAIRKLVALGYSKAAASTAFDRLSATVPLAGGRPRTARPPAPPAGREPGY